MSASGLHERLDARHPLQRLQSPSKGLSSVVHVLGLFDFYSCFKWLMNNPNKINESYGWHLQYLTIIGLSLSTLAFSFGLLADILNSPALFTMKNYLSLTATPLECLISILYWGLRLVSPSLVIPPDLPMLPLLIDCSFHLFPSLLLILDTLLLSPPWPTSPVNPRAGLFTLSVSTGLAFAYWFWIELCYSHNGWYPYPIFGLLSTGQRVALFAGSGGVMWAVGAGLRWAYRAVNGGGEQDDVGKNGSKKDV